jgi:hypothetical protein
MELQALHIELTGQAGSSRQPKEPQQTCPLLVTLNRMRRSYNLVLAGSTQGHTGPASPPTVIIRLNKAQRLLAWLWEMEVMYG